MKAEEIAKQIAQKITGIVSDCIKGGSGSGNFGHSGRPGERGGSGEGDGGGKEEGEPTGEKEKPEKVTAEGKEKGRAVNTLANALATPATGLEVESHTVTPAGVHNITAYTYGAGTQGYQGGYTSMAVNLNAYGFYRESSSGSPKLGNRIDTFKHEDTKDTIRLKEMNTRDRSGMIEVKATLSKLNYKRWGT